MWTQRAGLPTAPRMHALTCSWHNALIETASSGPMPSNRFRRALFSDTSRASPHSPGSASSSGASALKPPSGSSGSPRPPGEYAAPSSLSLASRPALRPSALETDRRRLGGVLMPLSTDPVRESLCAAVSSSFLFLALLGVSDGVFPMAEGLAPPRHPLGILCSG